MNFKKGNPGCPCDCESPSCIDNCYFPCGGEANIQNCLVCAVDIQLPSPDETGLDPLLLPPEECPDTAPCWACYIVFDAAFPTGAIGCSSQANTPKENTCEQWEIWWSFGSVAGSSRNYLSIIDAVIDGEAKPIYYAPCWKPDDHTCPYDAELEIDTCPDSNVSISSSWVNPGDNKSVILSGNEWDGECGTLTLTIRYAAVENAAAFNEVPIDGGEECNQPKWTEYVHVFELNYCECTDLYDPFTYVSTSTTDSCAGGVPDPCNFPEATITLLSSKIANPALNNRESCCACPCFNCAGYRNHELILTITGSVVNLTIAVRSASVLLGNVTEPSIIECNYSAAFCPEECDLSGGDGSAECQSSQIFIAIACLPCDKFTASLALTTNNGATVAYRAYTEPFDCGDSPIFITDPSFTGPAPCDLESHTFQLSLVPA